MPVDWECGTSTGGYRTWITWNSTSTSTTGTYATASNVWSGWNTTASATTYTVTANAGVVWQYWADNPNHTVVRVTARPTPPVLTAEQIAEQERLREERHQAHLLKVEAEEAAEERARDLLRLLLTDEQWAAYNERKEFVVTAPSGNRYRIRHGYAGNIALLGDDDGTDERLCIHPSMYLPEGGRLPEGDAVVAQVLMVTADEERFRTVANITHYRQRREQREAQAA